ncbi:HU family DNA-binding protein [uncultured Prevotella sp.]|uniref:HU family DNA-binding protein n=1 Tax=uncultured Prevotella sp. TaxID=159272 RepID=UPI00262BE8FF|nr:HU family DNA-binding protein [uncultured Prevotella sp.]
MTKADIIDEIVSSTGVARKDVTMAVEAFMESVKNSLLEKKENVYLRGFGSFIVKHRAEKTARNISKNTTIVIAAHDFPSFKPAKSFVSRMKGEEVVDID